jgi:oligopeptide transport system ATP-binding protein
VIFQDPYSSLNPRMTVGNIIAEPLENFLRPGKKEKDEQVEELLRLVGLNPNFKNKYPHEFSGGQRQRIGIARALALRPKLVVCDEPVSALDTSVQAQIINLLEDLQDQLDLTYLFIAHDLSVVRHISDRVMVMYLGKVVELSTASSINRTPCHPCTRALISSIPSTDPHAVPDRRLLDLLGEPPSSHKPPSGCRFHPRCQIAEAPGICTETEPALELKLNGQMAACHFSEKIFTELSDEDSRLSANLS